MFPSGSVRSWRVGDRRSTKGRRHASLPISTSAIKNYGAASGQNMLNLWRDKVGKETLRQHPKPFFDKLASVRPLVGLEVAKVLG